MTKLRTLNDILPLMTCEDLTYHEFCALTGQKELTPLQIILHIPVSVYRILNLYL